MTDVYDNENYNNKCRSCGAVDSFYRERTYTEKEILSIGDGYVDTEDSDMHAEDDWHYTCDFCGNSATELEDLLEEIYDEEDIEDFPSYF